MGLIRKHTRLRVPTPPRWPSKNPRDHRTGGRLSGWRSRRSQPATLPAELEDRLAGPQAPALSRIVRVRREDAVVHVELHAGRVVLDERPRVLARHVAGAVPAGTMPARGAAPDGEWSSWTVTLSLN